MPSYTIAQQKHTKDFMKNLVSFGDLKIMNTEEEMSLKDRVQLILDEMEGRDHGKKARLARIAKCSGPVVNHWLGDEQKEMNFEHAQRIAVALGYRVGWLMTGKGPRRPNEGEDVLQNGIELDLGQPEQLSAQGSAPAVSTEHDLYMQLNTDELKLITRYRNATKAGKTFIDMASINAPKEIPGKH